MEEAHVNKGGKHKEKIRQKRLNHSAVLVHYLAENHKHSGIKEWERKILNGQIEIDGQVVKDSNYTLKLTQVLIYTRLPWEEPSVPTKQIPSIYEDEDVLVIDKPSGLPVLPGGQFYEKTVLQQLKQQYKSDILAPVHRIGRGTSGALVVAKTKIACQELCKSFRNHSTMKKVYLALLQGILEKDKYEVTSPIGKIRYNACKYANYVWIATPDGKPSKSFIKVIERNHEGNYTFCKVEIVTGRNNQIRIHTAFTGHPLYGDPLYLPGGTVSNEFEVPSPDDEDYKPSVPLPGDCGYYLHSWKMRFPHPTKQGESTQVICPLPESFRKLVNSNY